MNQSIEQFSRQIMASQVLTSIASSPIKSYPELTEQKAVQFGLATKNHIAHNKPRSNAAFFLCGVQSCSRNDSTGWDTFMYAGFLCSLFANPSSRITNSLATIDSASITYIGA